MTLALSTGMVNWLENHQPKTYGNYIDGEWVNSGSGETFPIYNAANSERLLAAFQNSNKEDVNKAVEAAHIAFKKWSKVPGPERGSILFRFADLLEQDAEELAYMLSAEQGKTLAESKGEVLRAAKEARFCAGEAFRIEGNTLPGERSNVWSSTVRSPLGVVAAIAPWNFPVVTPVRKIAPALAYGCTVVYKPASLTPWTSVRLMELLAKAGVPDGVVNLVIGSGANVGDPLVNHPLVRGISFTGSSSLGIEINQKAAGRLAKTQLELGGKNPAIVLDFKDADAIANQIVSAAFACSGQRCTSISRVIVLKEKKQEVTEALIRQLENIRVGPSWEEGVTMGPLVNGSQLDSVQEYLKIGVAEGARVLFGGEILSEGHFSQGAYMKPALLDQVTPDMRVAKEEIFGPVLTVIEVENKEEALQVANNVEYGLAASVFTDEFSTVYHFSDQLEAGMIHINHGTASAAHMPFGGVKQSGAGAFSIGHTNADFFTEMKVVYFEY
ncbi:aldehyde dehydrogenase family protein [Mesobacillus foraminis]|uniref:aldehyde dehydrogenase family protein n=1 Tax=Mesobacillus foraminis TaxID=279826 RepID=UPI000EF55217|nr:aldehyde dehydrogenase family protein [Mesobacillus foraminis]